MTPKETEKYIQNIVERNERRNKLEKEFCDAYVKIIDCAQKGNTYGRKK